MAVNTGAVAPIDPAISRFLEVVGMTRELSANTLAAYRMDLIALSQWLAERNVPILQATRADLQEFIAGLRRPNTTARHICSCRRFFRYFLREGSIHEDPTAHIALPKIVRSSPRSLTEAEVEALLTAPVVSDPIGHRDRTILKVLYTTGLRGSELVDLRQNQLDLDKGVIRISGKRGRLVPLDEETIHVLQQFCGGARREILAGRPSHFVFPGTHSDRLTRQGICHIIQRYARKAGLTKGLTKELSPHTLRHAFAAHLVSHGTKLRVVQKLLGQNEGSRTQLYRHVMHERREKRRAERLVGRRR